MTTKGLELLVSELEKAPINSAANGVFTETLAPFESRYPLCCPWLHWLTHPTDAPTRSETDVPGIFLMQDWGNEGPCLACSIDEIKEAYKNGTSADTTLRNFMNDRWRAAIKDGWLVSNAIWGLRKNIADKVAPKCGYLGAKLHKMAFLNWGRLVWRLCQRTGPDFTLVVAGEWASFPNFPGEHGRMDLAEYLKLWRAWATEGYGKVVGELPSELSKESLGECRGEAVYVRHPATWHRSKQHDWATGPESRHH